MTGKLPKMDDKLRDVFVAAFQFLQARQIPDLADKDYWQRAADDMMLLSGKHNHPLMEKLLIAVYEYLNDVAVSAQGDDVDPPIAVQEGA